MAWRCSSVAVTGTCTCTSLWCTSICTSTTSTTITVTLRTDPGYPVSSTATFTRTNRSSTIIRTYPTPITGIGIRNDWNGTCRRSLYDELDTIGRIELVVPEGAANEMT